jgi:hypothetical protein
MVGETRPFLFVKGDQSMATQETNNENAALLYEIVKHVTLPFFIIPEATPVYIRFDSAILADTSSFSERVRKTKGDTGSKDPMDIANITNLQTGEVCRLVAHQVLKNTLTETYANDSYVTKTFKIVKTERKGGRGSKYFAFDITEIRLKSKGETAPAPIGKK